MFRKLKLKISLLFENVLKYHILLSDTGMSLIIQIGSCRQLNAKITNAVRMYKYLNCNPAPPVERSISKLLLVVVVVVAQGGRVVVGTRGDAESSPLLHAL